MPKNQKGFYWLRLILLPVLLVIVWGISLSIDIYTYSLVTDSSPADAAIVLGAATWGAEPSPVFEERIKHAISLYKSGQIQAIIFTGGMGHDEQLAESVVASQYAVQHGVAAHDIYSETRSTLTYENLRTDSASLTFFRQSIPDTNVAHYRQSIPDITVGQN